MKTNFRTMMLALAALGLFSCSEKLADETAQTQGEATEGFVAFKIGTLGTGSTRTRAEGDTPEDKESSGKHDGWETGDIENEYAITTDLGANVAFFFGTDGKYFGKSYLQLMGEKDNDDNHYSGTDSDKEKVYSARIRRNPNGTTDVKSCVVILNADPALLEKLDNITLEELKTKTDQEGLGRYGDYYTMSNTVYMQTTNGNNKVKGAEEVTEDNICDTWAKAQENPIRVHVERLVAKFEVGCTDQKFVEESSVITFTEEADQLPIWTEEGDSKDKWGIHISGWRVNGTETSIYWMKNLDETTLSGNDWKFGGWNYTFDATSSQFGWNDENYVRSYWAVDPHYNKSSDFYPQQFRQVTIGEDKDLNADYGDNGETKEDGTSKNETKNTCVLNYISYNEVLGQPKVIGTGELENYDYAPENTFGGYAFFDTNSTGENEEYKYVNDGYKRTSTHILVAAELLLGESEVNSGRSQSDKYCYQSTYWSETTAGEDLKNLKKVMVENLLAFKSLTLYTDKDTRTDETKFSSEDVLKYFDLVKATVKGGDGCLMLKLTNPLYDKNGNDMTTYKSRDTQKITDLEDAIYQVGVVKHFNQGKMYYAIPIQHMVPTLTKANKTHLFNIGSYGVVRNHWYKVDIKKIEKPGISVDDPDQPIIPNDEPYESAYVAFEIVIVPWHIINQNVEF